MNAAPFGLLRRARLCPVAIHRYRAATAARSCRRQYRGDRVLGHVAAMTAILLIRTAAHLDNEWMPRATVTA